MHALAIWLEGELIALTVLFLAQTKETNCLEDDIEITLTQVDA